MAYKIEFVQGEHHDKRGICFLISEHRTVTAKPVFDRLSISKKEKSIERSLRTNFDAWIGGQLNKSARYHGWNKSEFQGRYTRCFVFKAKDHRFYGFLCNPKLSDRSYQVCILVCHAKKNEHDTDETDLKQVEILREKFEVRLAIDKYFKETQ